MRVHIVCRDWQSDQVLARLAAVLVEQTNWTISPKPDPQADLNLYMPYLEGWTYRTFHKTPTAGWFTHADTANPSKYKMWVEIAKAVDLRLTSARLYMPELERFGPTVQVTPPVDHTRFGPDPSRARDAGLPRVGVSGYVYPGGRKGEGLVAQLAASDMGRKLEIVASGKGWPVPTINYAPEDLPEFYQGLDLFLCTATIEGIPLPPLEALACGIPCVLPRGVGLLDELPDAQNIARYEAGNYDQMEAAIRYALTQPVNVPSLTAIAARYTARAWADDIRGAVESLIYNEPQPVELPEWRDRAGVYIVAYGDPARECARRCIQSIRKYMPGLPVALASTEPLGIEDRHILARDEDIGGRSVKTQIYTLAPEEWQYVLYLDADTELVARVDYLFDLMVCGWELAMCTNPAQYHLAREMRRPDNAEEIDQTFAQLGTDEVLQLNGGVFVFRRCERVRRFFARWHTEWQRWGARDQAALDRALYDEPLRLLVLGKDWNCIDRYDQPVKSTAIVHHPMTARRWRGRINGRLDSSEAWGALHPGRVHPEPGREPPDRFDGFTKIKD